jgi:hypothetical protein
VANSLLETSPTKKSRPASPEKRASSSGCTSWAPPELLGGTRRHGVCIHEGQQLQDAAPGDIREELVDELLVRFTLEPWFVKTV